MEIINLALGEAEGMDTSFAGGLFSENGEQYYIYAITNGELTLLVRSDISLFELMHNIQEECEECSACDYNVKFWDAENKSSKENIVGFDLESVLAYCMEGDLESYQCWNNDGNEGLYEASESDNGLTFVIVHDLLFASYDNFQNIRSMAKNDREIKTLLELIEETGLISRE